MDDYADRFEAERYAGDERVVVSGAGRVHAVPERLFARAQQVASAYELRLLPAVDVNRRTELTPPQCRTLGEELEFVRRVVTDAVLEPHLAALAAIADEGWRSALPQGIVVEGP
jgi:hypothetical protein